MQVIFLYKKVCRSDCYENICPLCIPFKIINEVHTCLHTDNSYRSSGWSFKYLIVQARGTIMLLQPASSLQVQWPLFLSFVILHVEKVLQLHKHSRALKLVVTICLVATCMLSRFLFLTRYTVALCSVPAACCSYINALDCFASQNMKDSSENLI